MCSLKNISILVGLLAAGICLLPVGCQSETPPAQDSEAIWYQPDEPARRTPSLLITSENLAHATESTDVPEQEMPPSTSPPASAERESVSLESAIQAIPQSNKQDARYGIGASLNGFRPFPEDDPWNQKVTDWAVDPLSSRILAYIGLEGHLHPDFGSGTWNGSKIGIPYIVVSQDQPRVTIHYEAYGDESDPGPFPIPFQTPVEGDPGEEGDRHAIVIDRDQGILYELYRAFPRNGGASWSADSGAIFNLHTNTARPKGWTSADAAGLPIFPGLVRYDEVGEQQEIRHALRFTLDRTRRAYVPPASHWASSEEHPLLPPMGMRVRLRKEFDLKPFGPQVRVILKALQTYGMILADNGSDWFLSGCPDERWDNDELRQLRKIKVGDLEVLEMTGLVTPYSQ